jgi:branched-chain amino acid transport system permease protein
MKKWKAVPQLKRDKIFGAVIFLILLIFSFFASDSVLDFMSRTVIMMLFAEALNIILGFGGLRPLGMATYFGLGSYSYVVLVIRGHVPQIPAIILAMVISMGISLFINILCLRANDDLLFAFVSMGINTLLFTMVYKIPYVGSDTGLTGNNIRLAAFSSARGNFYLDFVVCTICIILIYLFFHSPFATVLKGSRDNLERLTFIGMNTMQVRLAACMVSSFFVTIAGILYAMRNMGAFPVMFSTNTSTEGLIMCLIGGMYSFFGPIIGAVILTFISTQVSIVTNYYQFILGAIIVLCVLFLRGGLIRDNVKKNLKSAEELAAKMKQKETGK